VKWIIVAQPRKGLINKSLNTHSTSCYFTRQHMTISCHIRPFSYVTAISNTDSEASQIVLFYWRYYAYTLKCSFYLSCQVFKLQWKESRWLVLPRNSCFCSYILPPVFCNCPCFRAMGVGIARVFPFLSFSSLLSLLSDLWLNLLRISKSSFSKTEIVHHKYLKW
jgi:hypothetical protein